MGFTTALVITPIREPTITISTDANQVLTVGLWHFKNAYYTNWGPLFAGYTIASIPLIILFAFTSRMFVKGLSALTASERLQTWKDYLTFHALNESASLLPKAYADLSFGFYGQTLSGTPKQRERCRKDRHAGMSGNTRMDVGARRKGRHHARKAR